MQCDMASFTMCHECDWLLSLSASLCMCSIWNAAIVYENVEITLVYMSPLKGKPLSNVTKELGLYVSLLVSILSEIVNDTLDISKFSTKPRLVEIDII